MPPNVDQDDPRVIVDKTPFPNPDLYFKVFDSERDEPETKYREDVNKLYARWQAKYGRKWPENGLNTEDLVWLYEEAYKDEKDAVEAAVASDGGRRPPGGRGKNRYVNREREDIPGELMESSEEALQAALKGLPKDPKARAAAVARAKEEVAGAAWVTDEFESDDYERGNMEAVHDMYLWDREGKPTVMPEDPPREEAGERSEDWDDFYGSLRPRHVESEDVRDALWATDEFESDEDNTESEWEPEYVGAGLGLKAEDPFNPQYSLRHSNHPLAPFPGEPLKWASYVYDDGTTFEGLTRDAVAHGMGVLVFGNGTGGGFQLRDVRRGDKYEGEFQVGYAHGLGQFTSPTTGEVYVGEFFAGQRHGCGVKIDMAPFYWLLERGEDPVAAYRRTYDKIMRNIEFRTWYRNQPLGDANEAESVLYTVREDLGSPWTALARDTMHETKLREWRALGPEEKVLTKMSDILDQVHSRSDNWDRVKGSGARVALRAAGALSGDESDGQDSIDLMVGHTTEGGYGWGWKNDTGDTDDYPFDDALAQKLAGEVLDDKIEEEDDRQAILGKDIVNPTTGLSLVDYLEGREAAHNEQLFKRYGVRDPGPELDTFIGDEDLDIVRKAPKLGAWTEARLLESLKRWNELEREDNPYAPPGARKNWAEEGSETRFETESDMMELCDLAETLGTLDEAEEIVARARMWRWKPYGEVTLRFAQDAAGQPVELMQDPLHYPHGTKWMAPGPLGQVHPLPEDRSIRVEMARAAKNYAHVHRMYNFDWDPTPGTAEWQVEQRIRRAQELQLRRLERMAGAVGEAEAAAAAGGGGGGGAQPAAVLAEAAAGGGGEARRAPPMASFAFGGLGLGGGAAWGGGGAWGGAAARAPQGMGRASRAVLSTLARAARRAPTLATGRPRLARPAARRRGGGGGGAAAADGGQLQQ
ncbi:hypothetical protein Rsub_09650 [Raphidocelis subcapitata]|uniref:Uncharacterized protein n=1 Tax=Raphidocelis subcapitata TaxID=307507 RepID=A0A2V0PAB5_9CHLO|nr:hypothetical protein Rsub_09650 [Raphidocelis subcapitata]|eukprot:GBF96794.1 hypothetical protein Rsub_09650 [Raphidocelis subcapitata]